jgi:hypothetical protein
MNRYHFALGSYWLIFVFLPVGLVAFVVGVGWTLGVFAVLILLAEHTFRAWKRLWRVQDQKVEKD